MIVVHVIQCHFKGKKFNLGFWFKLLCSYTVLVTAWVKMHVSYIWEVLTQPFCPFRCRGSRPQQPNREMGVVLQEVVHDPNFNYRILKEEGDPPLHVDPIYRIMYPGAVVYKDVCWIFNIITCFCMLLYIPTLS